ERGWYRSGWKLVVMTDAIWVPAWYELDQSVVVNDRDVFFFQTLKDADQRLVFSNFRGDQPFFEAEATIVRIRHQMLGEVQAILAEGLDYSILRADGSCARVEAEENPGYVYDTKEILNPSRFLIELADVQTLPGGDARALSGRSPEDLKRVHAERKLRWAKILGKAYPL
ncbi:MAG TPA: hypothetical protein VJ032_14760, partial [Thermoanaerobaculia bacterium]|nr:hypothetical protein [Thermoanaerobaculia bacterium]